MAHSLCRRRLGVVLSIALRLVLAAVLGLAAIAPASAQGNVTLTLSSTTLTFPDSDPTLAPSVNATENPVTITVKSTANTGGWTLSVLANSDLTSGTDIIPIGNITWTASGSSFNASGAMSRTTAQSVGSGPKGTFTGSLSFSFNNKWSYNTGSYSATIVYLLVGP